MATSSFPGAAGWLPERPTPGRLRDAVQDCRGCDLYLHATQGVMGAGNRRAPLLLVGEQPGDKEDLAGEPFVGPAGKVLGRALLDAGISAEDVWLTNAVKHFRWQGTRGKQRLHKTPSRGEVVACRPWLDAEVDVVGPTGVIVLGGTAGQAIYGSGFKVGESRGRLLEWPSEVDVRRAPEWVVATTHPSAVLRARDRDEVYAEMVDDFKLAAAALN